MTEEADNGTREGGAEGASARFTRVTVDIDTEVLEELDKLRHKLGMKSRGALLSQLLREIFIAEEQPSNAKGTGN
jgi:metal-responsive CopG/Arc/MetJ family transcriptional regulator